MAFWEVQNLSFAYPRREELLHSLSFTIEEGEAVALMGPNGSGKTTLGKLLVGILKPSAGQILLEGSDLAELSLAEIGAKVGYIFQNPEKQIFTPSVEEEIAFGLRFRGYDEAETRRRVNDMLAYFELTHCTGQFPYNLSQGEKQRLAIAAVLALEPRFIIFDEPTTGLDMRRKEKFAELLLKIRSMGAGYLLISHDRDFCGSCCERLLLLKEGKLSSADEVAAEA
jgi:energy-coupling factor transport system ATP-binding protein